MGMGGPLRFPCGMDLRPHSLGRDAGRTLARLGTRPRRRGSSDGTCAARHPCRHAELPPPRDTRPRRPRVGRPEWRPARPRARPGQRGPGCDGARARTVDTRRSPGPLRGVPPGAPADRGRRARGTHVHGDRPLHRRRSTQHTWRAAAAPPAHHRRRRGQGPRPCRHPREQLGHGRTHRARPGHARDHAGSGAPAAPPLRTRVRRRRPGLLEHRQSALVDPDRTRHHLARPVRRPRRPVCRARLRPVRAAPSGPDGALRR